MGCRNATVEDRDLIVMVDVDYYVDMPNFLLEFDKPVLLYTFTPSTAGKDVGEYKYRFNSDNTVDYLVSGGGHYVHPLWDWSGDALRVVRKDVTGMFTLEYATYAIERRQMDPDHSLILLTPLNRFSGISSWFLHEQLAAQDLCRLEPAQEGFTRLKINDVDGLKISTARVGQYSSATVFCETDDSIFNDAVTRKGDISNAAICLAMRNEKHEGKDGSEQGNKILWAYHKTSYKPTDIRIDLTSGVHRYQWVDRRGQVDFDAKPTMVKFMEPLVDGAFAPDKCLGNDQRAIDFRVEILKTDRVETIPYKVSKCMDDFVKLCFPNGPMLSPVTMDEVAERQTRPSQKKQMEEYLDYDVDTRATMMAKGEVYPYPKDTRPITMMDPRDKLDLAQFAYPLTDHFKKFHWYGPGKTPDKLSGRVAHICHDALAFVDSSDGVHLDGHINVVPRELYRRIMAAGFTPKWLSAMYDAVKRNYNKTVRSKFGESYWTGWCACREGC